MENLRRGRGQRGRDVTGGGAVRVDYDAIGMSSQAHEHRPNRT